VKAKRKKSVLGIYVCGNMGRGSSENSIYTMVTLKCGLLVHQVRTPPRGQKGKFGRCSQTDGRWPVLTIMKDQVGGKQGREEAHRPRVGGREWPRPAAECHILEAGCWRWSQKTLKEKSLGL
jgi:hypothetical protein